MKAAGSLLESVQALLERTFRMRTGVSDLGRFVIGDAGYRTLYGAERVVETVESGRAGPARTLVRETEGGIRACIYYPDALIRALERHPPQRGLHDGNVDEFGTLVEEVDHLLVVAERARIGRPVSLFELELHANVSKHLVLTRFLAGRGSTLDAGRRAWLRYHLFHKPGREHEEEGVRRRYHDARRWALRLVEGVAGLRPARRVEALRRFHDATAEGKLELIRSLSA